MHRALSMHGPFTMPPKRDIVFAKGGHHPSQSKSIKLQMVHAREKANLNMYAVCRGRLTRPRRQRRALRACISTSMQQQEVQPRRTWAAVRQNLAPSLRLSTARGCPRPQRCTPCCCMNVMLHCSRRSPLPSRPCEPPPAQCMHIQIYLFLSMRHYGDDDVCSLMLLLCWLG